MTWPGTAFSATYHKPDKQPILRVLTATLEPGANREAIFQFRAEAPFTKEAPESWGLQGFRFPAAREREGPDPIPLNPGTTPLGSGSGDPIQYDL